MKLRNKKTGEIALFENAVDIHDRLVVSTENGFVYFNSLAELNEKWEDYEETEKLWEIDRDGRIFELIPPDDTIINPYWKNKLEIGNYFKTKEEAEKAVEKLKAWKRLKDKGFKFEGWKRDEKYCGDFTITATDQISCDDKDLDLLFGGEE